MAEQSAGEALVLADADGNYYVLPRELIELSKAREDAKGRVEEYAGGETTGFTTLGAGFSFVGVMSLPSSSQWSQLSNKVGWPYYRPTTTPGQNQVDPSI